MNDALLDRCLNRETGSAIGALPLPVWGEGWGEGVTGLLMDPNPSPHPSPYGRGSPPNSRGRRHAIGPSARRSLWRWRLRIQLGVPIEIVEPAVVQVVRRE